jgi:hypothetical protein
MRCPVLSIGDLVHPHHIPHHTGVVVGIHKGQIKVYFFIDKKTLILPIGILMKLFYEPDI